MKNTTLAIFILIGGSMLSIAGLVLYILGLPMITNLLKESTPTPELVQSVEIAWVLASIALMLCGIWGMFIAISVRKNLRYLQKQALSLGTGVVVFGIYAFMYSFPNWKFLGFIFIGMFILVPGLLLKKEYIQ
jgi:hypothetical protein